jgi:hypothetical protein
VVRFGSTFAFGVRRSRGTGSSDARTRERELRNANSAPNIEPEHELSSEKIEA